MLQEKALKSVNLFNLNRNQSAEDGPLVVPSGRDRFRDKVFFYSLPSADKKAIEENTAALLGV